MTKTVGNIRVDHVDGQVYRLTVDTSLPYVDELEAVGDTFAEALASLQEKVEMFE